MTERCAECGKQTVWEQELGSAICTYCGTLANPAQSILASHLEHTDGSTYEYASHWNVHTQGSTLRGRSGWALAGQDKEARNRRNMVAMHEFIQSIVLRLTNAGVAPRAQALFDQAMTKGKYRWGRKAKITAGACIALAMREARKSDSLRDIAFLTDESFLALSRSFTSTINLLHFQLTSSDPSLHLSTLQTHLHTLIQTPSSASPPLPSQLAASLKPFVTHFPAIMQTATSLSTLVARLGVLSALPTPPTACAIYMLSLEGELSKSLPNAGTLAQALGSRMGVSKKVVMERYKIIYELIEEWIREVPWLERHEKKGGGKGRSKVAKRVVVARGLKDVVQFQEEIWQKKMEGLQRPALTLEVDDEPKPQIIPSQTRPQKRQTPHQRSVAQTSQFLLGPLSASTSTSRSRSRSTRDMNEHLDVFTHLLTVDSYSLSHAFSQPPSRLQVLLASREGAEESDIPDEELFEDGELESLVRSEAEIEVLRSALGWDWDVDDEVTEEKSETQPKDSTKKRKRGAKDETEKGAKKGAKRIDMDALARIMDPDSSLLDQDHEDEYHDLVPYTDNVDASNVLDYDQQYEEPENPHDASSTLPGGLGGDDGEEVVGEWRPLSPGGGGFDEDYYEI